MPIPPDSRRRLAEAMERRLTELDLRWVDVAIAGGTNVSVLAALRNGYPKGTRNRDATPTRRTKAAAERGLQWQPGSIDAILAGGAAVPLPPGGGQDSPAEVDFAAVAEDHGRRLTAIEGALAAVGADEHGAPVSDGEYGWAAVPHGHADGPYADDPYLQGIWEASAGLKDENARRGAVELGRQRRERMQGDTRERRRA